jgi:tight adherence protein C
MSAVLGIGLFFGAASLMLYAVSDFALERREVFNNLRQVQTIDLSPYALRHRELATPFFQRVALPSVRRLGRMGRRFTPQSVVQRLQREIDYAGSPAGLDPERILATKFLALIGMPLAAFVMSKVLHFQGPRMIVMMLLACAIGYYGPEWTLRARSGTRQNEIRRALPDALDLLSITVEAGLAFDAAVGRVAQHAGGPLGQEFHRFLQETQLGKSRTDALRDLGERSTVQEMKSFALAMIQAEVFGVSIANVLQTQAHSLRVKRRQRAEEKGQKLQVKIVFPLLLCVFPSLFVILLGPAMLQIYHTLLHRG